MQWLPQLYLNSNMVLLIPANPIGLVIIAIAFKFQYGSTDTPCMSAEAIYDKRFKFQYGSTDTFPANVT